MIRCQHCNIPYNSKDLFVCCTCYNDGEECIMFQECKQEHQEANYDLFSCNVCRLKYNNGPVSKIS